MKDSNNSVALSDAKDRSPNQGLVEALERLLCEAKSGEIRSFVGVVSFDCGGVSRLWQIDARSSMRLMLAELVMMQNDLIDNIGIEEGDSVLAQNLD